MQKNSEQDPIDVHSVSRRDFLKFCSLMVGAIAMPRGLANGMEQAMTPQPASDAPLYFQWQNKYLCKTIYPMREVKLRDFLIYYMEVDVWSHYKNKDINTLANEVGEYKEAWELNAIAAQKEYTALRDYFRRDASAGHFNFQPIDEAELAEINALHALFIGYWPKDIRGERSFVESMSAKWLRHYNGIRDWIKSRTRRHAAMDPNHEKYDIEGAELEFKESVTLPMAEQELGQLRAFLATYDRIEERKLAWYRLSKKDPNFNTPEAAFVVKFPSERQVTIRDLAHWKVEEYAKFLAGKNQYELLDMIHQRFEKEPKRYPLWLRYMVVHFSGMRYASAHGSWADPKDLIIRLRVLAMEREINALDDVTIEARCKEKAAIYEAAGGTDRPKLALASEKKWKDKALLHLSSIKAGGPKTRRAGLIALLEDEIIYELETLTAAAALKILSNMKPLFPKWAWKEMVKLTPLRVTEVSSQDWEKLSPQEAAERDAQRNSDIYTAVRAWQIHDPSAWREEHGRTQEVIVTRAVCNEAAEHCQHIRGRLPPGGLASRPKWYLANEAEGKLPGAYFVKPTSEKDYMPGASILWLRFVPLAGSNPPQWQIARWVETQQKVGLLPAEFRTRRAKEGEWTYKFGDIVTRSRTIVTQDDITLDERKVVETQWLRWIHEATVAEVAETADGMEVITFETALPGGDSATSAVGTFKHSLNWLLSDGTEDQYNRSFVGYVPEGRVPVENLEALLDWNRIFNNL